MTDIIKQKLDKMGIYLPTPTKSVANYLPYIITNNLIYVSGQITVLEDEIKYLGRLGENLSVEDGMAAARLCAINLLSQLNEALDGQLDRITKVVKLGGFVNCTHEFADQPKVINGASDFMVQVFGDKGRHARSAVGVNSLPLGVAVEVDGVFEFE